MVASKRRHWEQVYLTKKEDELSWHQDEPTLSLRWIRTFANHRSRIVDIGGGTSTLARRLVESGFPEVTVLDIADAAIRSSSTLPGIQAPEIRRIRADVTKLEKLGRFDLWHDRAVFHFLTDPEERRKYVALARKTVPVGGHLILATFAKDGPEKCSGLTVERYDARRLETEFSRGFELVRGTREVHHTPWGTRQPFVYVVLRRVRSRPSSRIA